MNNQLFRLFLKFVFIIFLINQNPNQMLGLIFIYFIGKAYYTLAEEHNKNKWLFAITGVLSYYGGSFFGGVIAYLFYDIMSVNNVAINEGILTVIGILLGLLTCWVYYYSFVLSVVHPYRNNPVLEYR